LFTEERVENARDARRLPQVLTLNGKIPNAHSNALLYAIYRCADDAHRLSTLHRSAVVGTDKKPTGANLTPGKAAAGMERFLSCCLSGSE